MPFPPPLTPPDEAAPARWSRRQAAFALALGALVGAAAQRPARAQAQGVDLTLAELQRRDGALVLDFAARLVLPRPVEDALLRGVPLYFLAEAELYRSRWYWRDQRVARVARSWRLALQPLTSSWRVSLGGLSQSFTALDDALIAVSRSSGWRLIELAQLDPGQRYRVEFSYRLDTAQLPSPMQINFGGAASSWNLGVERVLSVD